MSARAEIVAHLTATLPADYDVLEFARDLDDLRATTVMVETTRIEASTAAGYWQATCTVWVVARFEDYVAAELALETAVVDVMLALDKLSSISLGATRVELGDSKHHAYRVELVVPVVKDTDTQE